MASPRVKPEPTTDEGSSQTPQIEIEPNDETSKPYLHPETIQEKSSRTPQVKIDYYNETSEPTSYLKAIGEESLQTPQVEGNPSNETSTSNLYPKTINENSSQTPQKEIEPSSELSKPIFCREYWVRDECPGTISRLPHSMIHKAMNCIKIPCDTNTCEATHIYVPPHNSKSWPAKGYWFEIEPIAYGYDEATIDPCWSCKGMLKMPEWRLHFPPLKVQAYDSVFFGAQVLEAKERIPIKMPIFKVIMDWVANTLNSEGHRRDVHGR